jgi:hypothetical protein
MLPADDGDAADEAAARRAPGASIGTHIPCSAPNRRGFESAARFVRGSDPRILQEYRLAA